MERRKVRTFYFLVLRNLYRTRTFDPKTNRARSKLVISCITVFLHRIWLFVRVCHVYRDSSHSDGKPKESLSCDVKWQAQTLWECLIQTITFCLYLISQYFHFKLSFVCFGDQHHGFWSPWQEIADRELWGVFPSCVLSLTHRAIYNKWW